MDQKFRNKLDEKGDLYYKHVHTLMMCITAKGLKKLIDLSGDKIDVNFVVRPFEVYNSEKARLEYKNLVKIEIFFLSYYHLVENQSFLLVEREDVN